MRFLVGTIAHNQHIQNIVGALYEAGALAGFYGGGVDHWKSNSSRRVRAVMGKWLPQVNARLARRRIATIPEDFIVGDWKWEAWRLFAHHAGMGPRIEDWFWERSEYGLDRRCADLIQHREFDAFFGTEHGALFSVRAAASIGKKTVVAFLSPHHKTRERWLAPQYERFPELLTPAVRRLRQLARRRDERRDAEADAADVLHCASNFTRDSLIAAGHCPRKMVTVSLGCPEALAPVQLAGSHSRRRIRFVYAGPVAVHKGAHLLLEAWRSLRAPGVAELHFYGQVGLPKALVTHPEPGVFLHGAVSRADMTRAYQEASVLVFPTLCDGFGMVAAEAWAHGVPVITTPNAGAADLIRHGRNGYLVPPGDATALAERMEWCIAHPSDLVAMREEALATARRWTWTQFRSSFRNQLFSILGSTVAA